MITTWHLIFFISKEETKKMKKLLIFLSIILIAGITSANASVVIDFSDMSLGVDGFYEGPQDFHSGNATFNANTSTYGDYWSNYAASSWDSDMSTVEHPLWTTDSGFDHTVTDDNHMGLFYPMAPWTGTDRFTFDTVVTFEEMWLAECYDTVNHYPVTNYQSVDVEAYDSLDILIYSAIVDLDGTGAWTLFAPDSWTGVKEIQLTNFTNNPDPNDWAPWVACIDDIKTSPVPIPGAVWLLGSGLLCLFGIRRRIS